MAKMIPIHKDFLNKISPEPNTGCWLWTGALDADGYGNTYYKTHENVRKAHRYSYFKFKGDLRNLCVMHSCDTRSCVNPDHLTLGTSQENTADRHRKNRNAKGSKHGNSSLTEEQVLKILQLYSTNKYGRCKLERMFNVSSHAIFCIITGITWKHVEFDREIIKQVHEFRKSNWKCNHSLR